jgi:hypothetical protein
MGMHGCGTTIYGHVVMAIKFNYGNIFNSVLIDLLYVHQGDCRTAIDESDWPIRTVMVQVLSVVWSPLLRTFAHHFAWAVQTFNRSPELELATPILPNCMSGPC